jgi:hypothetical protein
MQRQYLTKMEYQHKNSYMKYNNDREDRKDRLLLAQICQLEQMMNSQCQLETKGDSNECKVHA